MLWKPAFFGVKPGAGAEGRLHRLGADGRSERVDPDAAAVVHAADVRRLRPRDRGDVAGVRLAGRRSTPATVQRYGLRKRLAAVRGCRTIGKRDMKLNDALPKITVDAETYAVIADGEILTAQPAQRAAAGAAVFLF